MKNESATENLPERKKTRARLVAYAQDPVLDLLAVLTAKAVRRSSWRTVQNIGKSIGWLACRTSRRKRIQTHSNLHGAGSTLRTGCQKAWKNMGQTVLETLWLTGQPSDRTLQHVRIKGLDVLSDAAREGRGVLLVSGHISNWELVALAAGRAAARVAVVAEPMKTPRLERTMVALRERSGVRTLMRGKPGASVVAARWLLRGGVLGCMMDRSKFGKLTTVPFLEQATRIPIGPAELASRAGAAVILGSANRQQDGSIDVGFKRLAHAEGRQPLEMAWIVGRALEQEVLANPDQWFWIARRHPCSRVVDSRLAGFVSRTVTSPLENQPAKTSLGPVLKSNRADGVHAG